MAPLVGAAPAQLREEDPAPAAPCGPGEAASDGATPITSTASMVWIAATAIRPITLGIGSRPLSVAARRHAIRESTPRRIAKDLPALGGPAREASVVNQLQLNRWIGCDCHRKRADAPITPAHDDWYERC